MVVKLREECLKRGPITHAVCRFYKYFIEPFTGARDHMMDDTVHSIDTLRWICGGEVVGIESHCKRVGVPDINYISATLQFDNGSTGYLINSWCSGKRVFEVEMHSPGVYVSAEHENKAHLFAEGDLNGVEYDTRKVAGSDEFYVFTGVDAMVRDFVDSIKSGTQPQACFKNSIKTMEIAEKILAQALVEGV
jgi:predicted dehydrogenase